MKYLYTLETNVKPALNWGEEIKIGSIRGIVIETFYNNVIELGHITLSSDQPPETLPLNFQFFFCGTI